MRGEAAAVGQPQIGLDAQIAQRAHDVHRTRGAALEPGRREEAADLDQRHRARVHVDVEAFAARETHRRLSVDDGMRAAIAMVEIRRRRRAAWRSNRSSSPSR